MLAASPISSARLELTPLQVDDADAMVAVLADARMYEFTGGEPPTRESLRARYGRLAVGQSADGTEAWCNWIVRPVASPDPVGVVQATVASDGTTADVAWEIGVPWQGRGYATEAAIAMVAWLEAHGVGTVRALIHPAHVASARVAERVGLVPTAEREDGEVVWVIPVRRRRRVVTMAEDPVREHLGRG